MNEKLLSIWREAWPPPDRRPPWAWAEEHISSIPGRFRSEKSPQIREPLEAVATDMRSRSDSTAHECCYSNR